VKSFRGGRRRRRYEKRNEKRHTNKRKRKNRIDYKKTGVSGNCI
jgi:hypothetical protein